MLDYDKYLNFLQKTQNSNNKTENIFIALHTPCFTLGVNASLNDILHSDDIPVFQSTRAGGATYHDPGQLMLYPMIDLKKRKITASYFIDILHNWAIEALKKCDILASRSAEPGLWKNDKKIAFMGLAVKNGLTHHGMAFNLTNCNLSNFEKIIPCKKIQPIGTCNTSFEILYNALTQTNPVNMKLKFLNNEIIQQLQP